MTQTFEGLYQIQWQNTEIKFGELPRPSLNFIAETKDWKRSDVLRGSCPVSNQINECKQKHVFKKHKSLQNLNTSKNPQSATCILNTRT